MGEPREDTKRITYKDGSIWFGERYLRKREKTWRDRHSGEIYPSPTSTRPIGTEQDYGHVSGGDRFRVGSKILPVSQKKNYRYNVSAHRFVPRRELNRYKAV